MRDIRRVLIVMRYHLKELLGDNVDRKMMLAKISLTFILGIIITLILIGN
jgi:hypothetical protein